MHTHRPVGSQKAARDIANAYQRWREHGDLPDGWTFIGRGDHRAAFRHGDTVYKIETSRWFGGRNQREHELLTTWRADGHDFAPPTALYEVATASHDSPGTAPPHPVIAMPYFENDGSEPTNLAALQAAMARADILDLNPSNWRCRAGHAVLIDAAGI